jgi:histidine ammonia-lyase
MSSNEGAVQLGYSLSIQDVVDVARHGRKVSVDDAVRQRVEDARAPIDALVAAGDKAPAVYGINTGFGALAETRVAAGELRNLQRNLIRSHATGVGPALECAEVRAMMLLRAQVLALGHSGVRTVVLEHLVSMLNARIHPWIPSQGSVGASGDLSPLAHLTLAMLGEGEVRTERGQRAPAGAALQAAGLSPLALEAKEGLALINGTQFMTALGVLAVDEASYLCRVADIAGAMTLEAQKGTTVPFDARLHAVRPHPGQAVVATNLRALLAESQIAESHHDCQKVQDAYSLRCMPQVHGATRDALGFARDVLTREVNSVTDNPSVFLDQGKLEVLSGGNFHGQPIALALDLAAIAVAELGNISERRVEQLVNPALSSGLSPFLAAPGGLHSGFMISQVVSAALVSENKVLCHPASVDSIPSSAGKEDHVSMGSISARKLPRVVENVRRCLAIELMVAAAGVDQRRPLTPSKGVSAAMREIRAKVAEFGEDRILYTDIESLDALLVTQHFGQSVIAAVGALA